MRSLCHLEVLLILLALAPWTRFQDDRPVRCTHCQNRGMRACEEHKKPDCELEINARYCTLLDGCLSCAGAGWVDCNFCKNPAVEARLAKKREALPGLAQGLAHFSEEMGRPLALAQSENFILVFEIPLAKVGKTKLRKHELLHLYLDRLEAQFDAYLKLMQISRKEFTRTPVVMVWENQKEHHKASQLYTGQVADGGVRLMGAKPVYSIAGVPELFTSDEQLHRNLVHNVTHLLMPSQTPIFWIGNRKGGWADEGLAHWFEDYFFQVCDNYCYQESDTQVGFKGGKWKSSLRKELAQDSARLLPMLFEQNTDTLSPFQHAVAFSLVDYLAKQDGAKLNQLLVLMRQKLDTREALKQVHGLTVLALEDGWRTWVAETYPSR